MSVTYDAGALIAVDRDDPLMFARHRQAVSVGLVPVVPAPVIWQVWRDGSKQARLARFLKGWTISASARLTVTFVRAGAQFSTNSSEQGRVDVGHAGSVDTGGWSVDTN